MSDHVEPIDTTSELRLQAERIQKILRKPVKPRPKPAPAPKPKSFWSRLLSLFTAIVLSTTGVVVMALIVQACEPVELRASSAAAIQRIDAIAEGQPAWLQRLGEREKEAVRRANR